jgi:hypothetical protein
MMGVLVNVAFATEGADLIKRWDGDLHFSRNNEDVASEYVFALCVLTPSILTTILTCLETRWQRPH